MYIIAKVFANKHRLCDFFIITCNPHLIPNKNAKLHAITYNARSAFSL